MEFHDKEMAVLNEVVTEDVRELSELQLALIGGGIGETSL
jgi:hypothetical protein